MVLGDVFVSCRGIGCRTPSRPDTAMCNVVGSPLTRLVFGALRLILTTLTGAAAVTPPSLSCMLVGPDTFGGGAATSLRGDSAISSAGRPPIPSVVFAALPPNGPLTGNGWPAATTCGKWKSLGTGGRANGFC